MCFFVRHLSVFGIRRQACMAILMKNKRLICDSTQKNKAAIRIIVFYFRLLYNNIVMEIFS